MTDRFGPEHLETWRRDGAVLIRDFFTPGEVAAVRADFETVFGPGPDEAAALVKTREGEVGRFHASQFKGVAPVPLDCSAALNLIGVHPALIAFAKAALGVDTVQLYQCQAWAKFTGESDYGQPFHCDFANHTLTVPAEDAHLNAVPILCYFSDVTEDHGPMHYVTRPDAEAIAPPEAGFGLEREGFIARQQALKAHERSSAAPAGAIVPYGIDIYHRGTNLTAPGGHRYALMTCFKAAGNETIGYHAWPYHHLAPWARIFNHASPEQLECFGVKPPGDPFWTPVTLARAQARHPGWDLTPYRAALAA
jgi:hypothetical protein